MKLPLLLLTLFAAGCVTHAPEIPETSSADRANYAGWDSVGLADRNASLDDLIKVAGAKRELISVVGPILYGFANLYPLYTEIARLKGEQIAVKEALSKCPIR